ncbi:MAG: outer membrane beta-barrel domain-containing protein [Bdellovibrionales bacterium]|nr:outer membrane beta-barrel domain-containing protein [Bdellovibrionales bacterium]
MSIKLLTSILCMSFLSLSSNAQQIDGLEDLYDRYDREEQLKEQRAERISRKKQKKIDVNNLSQLAQLSAFEDIAIIQRKFLPKTERFELSGSGMFTMNNPFFNNMGASLRLSYYFTEEWGVEFNYTTLSVSEKDVTENLVKRNIQTDSLVKPESYTGISVKWAPIYGKMALVDKKIVPFDIYFAAGLGQTKTQDSNDITFTGSTGQIFAITKSIAFKWDLTVNFYSPEIQTSSGDTLKQNQEDLILGLGISYFFPEATYR